MFSLYNAIALFAIAAAGANVAATPHAESPLKVEFSKPEASVESIKDLVFTAKVTNTGSEDVKVLKYNTVLDSLPTRSFSVKKDGADVNFNGVRLNVNLDAGDSAYTTIPAGQTVEVEHNVSELYDFASGGLGKFSFEPRASFKFASASGSEKVQLSSLQNAIPEVSPFEIEVTSDVAKRSNSWVHKRSEPDCDDSSKLDFITASYSEGKDLASGGVDYIGSGGALVEDYFGGNSPDDVSDILDGVATESDSSRTLGCTDPANACDGNVIAYTIISTTDIYYCDIFFDEVATEELCGSVTVNDRAIRGGTTLHEMTHALSGTDDITYGCDADQELSDSEKIGNADNFNCFTTAVYAETQC